MDAVNTSLNISTFVDTWYARWLLLSDWKRSVTRYGERAAYEICAIRERWSVTAFCYYGSDWLSQEDFTKLTEEINACKKIVPRERRDIIASIITNVAAMRDAAPANKTATIVAGTYAYGIFRPQLRDTFAAEFAKYDTAAVVEMLLRYECLCPHGQQWAVPTRWLSTVQKLFGLNLIAFASPINRGADVPYCSGAAEDAQFGSLGSFLKLDPASVLTATVSTSIPAAIPTSIPTSISASTFTIEVNPPFIEQVLKSAVVQVEAFLRAIASQGLHLHMTVLFIGPDWTDAEFHTRIREHLPTLPGVSVRSEKLSAGEYSYENATTGRVITTRQNSWLHVITNYSVPVADVKTLVAAM